jgi:YbbR domain-containing protein
MRKNLGYKILALAVALFCWVKVTSDRNPNIVRPVENVSIDYRGLQPDYVITNAPSSVTINVMGPQSDLRVLEPSQIKVRVDLSAAKSGQQQIKTIVTLPPGIADRVTPTPLSVPVEIEPVKRRSQKIDISLKGVAPIGYTVGKATADPPIAVVSGRSSLVDAVRRLTVVIDAGSAQAGEEYYPVIPLDAAGKEVQGLIVEPGRAAVKLQLVEAPATKIVIVSPTIVGQPAFPFKVARVTVVPQTVTISGRPNALIGVSTVSTEKIDISNANASVIRTVELDTPRGIDSGGTQRVRVVVTIAQ